jgi:cytochrome P450
MSKQYALEVPVIPELDPSLIVDVDLFGPEIKAHPEPLFAEWASKPPFYAMVNGRPNVVICRHADVDKAFVDFDTFSVEPRPGWGGDPFDYFNSLPTVGDIDPPDHTRLRKLMQPAFTPKRVNELQAGVDALTDQMLEEMAEKGTFDMMKEFAQPLSRRILLGNFFQFREEDWHIFIDFSDAGKWVSTVPPGAPKPEPYMVAYNAGKQFCEDYIELRRNEPKDDIVGSIIAAHDVGGKITSLELFGALITLFVAGLGTIAGTLTLSIKRLLENPDQLQLLRDDPTLVNQAVEECLRIDSIGNFRHRFVTKDTVLNGTPIYRGMIAQVSMGASNYDPDFYSDPDKFDIMRKPRDISTFGYGAHFCIGHALARAVVRTGIAKLVTRFPNLRLTDPHAEMAYAGLPTERMPVSLMLSVE